MADKIASLFHWLSPEILTALLAALPVTELRGAIPWSIFVLKLDWQSAIGWSLIGNILPVPAILILLDPVQQELRRFIVMDRFFNWIFARTRRRGKLVETYKAIGLALFVAIPLPVTGAWTGAIAAYLFGIRFIPALIAISIGVTIAGIVVTLACMGFIGFWDLSQRF